MDSRRRVFSAGFAQEIGPCTSHSSDQTQVNYTEMPAPFRFTDARQRTIHERLRLVGQGTAAFFLDACRLMASRDLETTTHMVAHALREIESALRDVLEPMAPRTPSNPKSQSGDEQHRNEIRTILAALEIEETDAIAEAWLRLPGKNSSYGLHRRAHRSALAAPRRIDQEFLDFWQELNAILDVILDRFAAKYLDSHRILDELLKVEAPTDGHADRLRSSVPNNLTAFGYFFERLDNPAWLKPLQHKGLFDDPAPPEVDDAGATRHPIWPQSRYLARMAALNSDEIKNAVFEIAEKIGDLGNASVQEDLISIALALPSHQAVAFASRAAKWSPSPYPPMLEKLGDFVTHLAIGDAAEEAFDLANALFAPSNSSRRDSRFLYWRYEKGLKHALKGLTQADRLRTLKWLLDLLDRSLAQRIGGTNRKRDDSSRSWRPSVQDQKEQRDDDPKDILTTATRDTAQAAFDSPDIGPTTTVEVLESMDWGICRRIALYLLTTPSAPHDLVRPRLLDRTNANDHNMEYEYTNLLREHFGTLRQEDQEIILVNIENGPPYMENARANYREWLKRDITADEEAKLIKQWQRDRLAPIQQSLIPLWKRRYDGLVAELGSPPDLEDTIRHRVRWAPGPASPKSEDEFRALSPTQVTEFLRDWEPPPPSEYRETRPTRDGLATMLRRCVINDPTRHSSAAEHYVGLHPIYIGALLQALSEAAHRNGILTWEPVVKLMNWAALQEDQEDQEDGATSPPSWQATREAIPGLLDNGWEQGPNEIPLNLRADVWNLLEELTNDPDPTPEKEKGRDDPVAVAINSVRGRALHSAIRYGVWVQRQLKTEARTFDDFPELRLLLERHLDEQIDPSLAIRSVYGERFPLLHYLDADWTERHASDIFPLRGNDSLRDAAWDAYLSVNPAYGAPAKLILPHYDAAIEKLRSTETEGDPSTLEERLADHLFVLYAADLSQDCGERLRRFYERAAPSLRAHAMYVAGETLDREKRGDKWHTQCLDLWNERKAVAQRSPEAHRNEIAQFGTWFGNDSLDEDWALRELAEALRIARRIEHDFVVTKRLADLAPRHASAVLDCLRLMVEGEREPWSLHSWCDDMRVILKTTLATPESHDGARELINRLAAMNHLEFADLLDGPKN